MAAAEEKKEEKQEFWSNFVSPRNIYVGRGQDATVIRTKELFKKPVQRLETFGETKEAALLRKNCWRRLEDVLTDPRVAKTNIELVLQPVTTLPKRVVQVRIFVSSKKELRFQTILAAKSRGKTEERILDWWRSNLAKDGLRLTRAVVEQLMPDLRQIEVIAKTTRKENHNYARARSLCGAINYLTNAVSVIVPEQTLSRAPSTFVQNIISALTSIAPGIVVDRISKATASPNATRWTATEEEEALSVEREEEEEEKEEKEETKAGKRQRVRTRAGYAECQQVVQEFLSAQKVRQSFWIFIPLVHPLARFMEGPPLSHIAEPGFQLTLHDDELFIQVWTREKHRDIFQTIFKYFAQQVPEANLKFDSHEFLNKPAQRRITLAHLTFRSKPEKKYVAQLLCSFLKDARLLRLNLNENIERPLVTVYTLEQHLELLQLLRSVAPEPDLPLHLGAADWLSASWKAALEERHISVIKEDEE